MIARGLALLAIASTACARSCLALLAIASTAWARFCLALLAIASTACALAACPRPSLIGRPCTVDADCVDATLRCADGACAADEGDGEGEGEGEGEGDEGEGEGDGPGEGEGEGDGPGEGEGEGDGPGEGEGDGPGEGEGEGDFEDLDVIPLLPTSPDFLDWAGLLSRAPCSTDPGELCFNAGAVRKVVTTNDAGCHALSMHDELDVFDWTCAHEAGDLSGAVFTSSFKTGRGLRDLIDGAGFLDNSVALFVDGNIEVGRSPATPWWTDVVTPLDFAADGETTELSASGIYFAPETITAQFVISATTDTTAVTYAPGGAGIALVIGRGAVVLAPATSDMLECTSDGGAVRPAKSCAVLVKGSDRVWIEGIFEGAAPAAEVERDVISIDDAAHVIVNGVLIREAPQAAVFVDASSHVFLRDVEVRGAATGGVEINDSTVVLGTDLRIAATGRDGISVNAATGLSLEHVRVVSSGRHGVRVANAVSAAILSDIIVMGSLNEGVRVNNSERATVTRVTSFMNGGTGVALDDVVGAVASNILAARNNKGVLFTSAGISNVTLFDVAALDNSGPGIELAGAVTAHLAHGPSVLVVGSNGALDCSVDATAQGLVDTVCSVDDIDVVAGVSVDPQLAAQPGGVAIYPLDVGNFDWFPREDVENAEGAILWGVDVTGPPGPWLSPQAGTRHDLRLRSGALTHVAAPGGFGVDTCPALGFVTADVGALPRGVIEPIDDFFGDADGSCDVGDRCVVTPHIGAWQGREPFTRCDEGGFLLGATVTTLP